jgi:hypothetical protein
MMLLAFLHSSAVAELGLCGLKLVCLKSPEKSNLLMYLEGK